jgi:hypothetical protein
MSDIREMMWQEATEDCIMRCYINLYASRNIIRVIKSKMRWAGYVVCMGDEKCIQNFGQKT